MADSELLKDFKSVWAQSCQSMWAELLAITMAQSHVIANYGALPADKLLTDMFYAPELKSRLGDLNKDRFLERVETYRTTVVANRLVVLSASFETYFSGFLEAFIRRKPKFFDGATDSRTKEGDKLYGDVIKVRGLAERITAFGELAPSKIKSATVGLSYLRDVYIMRNVLAHRAGLVDRHAAETITHVSFREGERIRITTNQLLMLASPVIEIARSLDSKL
jgi:hypothetical protein